MKNLDSAELVELIAKAIWKAWEECNPWCLPVPFDSIKEANKNYLYVQAKAAITALREAMQMDKIQALTNAEFARMERYESLDDGEYTTGWLDCLVDMGFITESTEGAQE